MTLVPLSFALHVTVPLQVHESVQVFSVVDIDPYGSPTGLLDMAVQSVKDGGLMAVTATDMAVLCGNNAEACFTKYGCYSIHRDYNHEQALRILLACIAMHAARHKRVIEPILCLSIDFYIRVFVRVRISAAESKHTASKLSYLWQSSGCDSWWLQPAGTSTDNKSGKGNDCKFAVGKGPPMPQVCPISGGKFHMGGPIWSEALFQADIVQQIFDDIKVRSVSHYAVRNTLQDQVCCSLTHEQTDVAAACVIRSWHDWAASRHSRSLHERFSNTASAPSLQTDASCNQM